MSKPAGQEPELVEVPGPSALGGGWRRFRDLLVLVAVSDFKKTYFGTALGYIWSLARPLLLFVVLLFVFTRIFRIGSEVEFYPVLLLFNIVMISFFQEATIGAVASVVNQEGVVRKTQFPRLVIPLAVVVTGFFNFCLNLIAVLIFVLAFGVPVTWTWLLYPLILIALFVFTLAVAMLLSSLYVRYRDIGIIWSVLVTVFFYGTPVLYPIEIVPAQYVDWILLNPLTPVFEQARHWVIDSGSPSAVAAAGGWAGLIPPALIYLAVCGLAIFVFRREAPRIAEDL